jgi:aminoglycoside phosphotransferase (APT) family kinase protein
LGSAIQLDNHEGLNQLAMALANLHGLQIDLQDLDRLLGISLPAPSVLLNSSRKQMITEIEEAIQIVPLDLARELEEAVKVLLDQPPTPYLSLNHGDFHTNNGLLAPRNDQPFLVLIDWEDALLESPLFDLAHFIFMSGMEAGRLFVRAYIASADQLLDDVLKGSDPSLLWALACMFSGRAFRWKYLRDPKSCSDFYGESFGLIKELKTLSQKGLLL